MEVEVGGASIPQRLNRSTLRRSNAAGIRAVVRSRQSPARHSPAPFITQAAASALSFTTTLGLLLVSRIYFNRVWRALQLATFCNGIARFFHAQMHPVPSRALQIISAPVAAITAARPVFIFVFPDLYRTAKFWRRLIPIYTRYMITKLRVRKLSMPERNKFWSKRHEWGGEKVHQLVLDMSGFYVKSAQILASKADFVPDEWRKWLSKHLDDAPPKPFTQVKRSIEKELSRKDASFSLDALFLNVEEEAVAAASIAQVHGATLKDGTAAVIKVQHLGVDITMRSDLRNLGRVARFLRGQLPVDLVPIVKEIQATIPLEFNFEREVYFMTEIRKNLVSSGHTNIVCPYPIQNMCTQRLIVMERLYGIPFTRILHPDADESLQARIPELWLAVKHLIDAYGQMLLVDGVFHADPHAGNLLLLPGCRVGLLDFGQSKILSEACRKQLARMIVALASGDDAAAAQALSDMGMHFGNQGEQVSVQVLAMMARMLFDTCYVEEATVSPMADNSILRKVPMRAFNQELWLVVRTILILRGLLFSLKMDVSAVASWRNSAENLLADG